MIAPFIADAAIIAGATKSAYPTTLPPTWNEPISAPTPMPMENR